ncbi:short-chain dehydrogenase [Pontibacillus halophilus JSM 076056 = DSM 19796]|uniref:Short-chain dehydrogenase n=1 Tax=Pontibacillus halophilus JSM 076056 = DSM 19796 TaxID=1385510 RepID=A0A0A5GI12_9BACI|nr:(S)-benzoin forming benzil reductase [Pontibacillus halophilus]KGX92886.1 short-chain dehydrogenase [Pontibacillus halophilus JSM 076056 = DSM 19796]
MKYAIVTGISKGLGASIAKQFIEDGVHIIGVSRTKNEELANMAEEKQLDYVHYSCNLAYESELTDTFTSIYQYVQDKEAEYVYLVNNAGVIEPIEKVGSLDHKAVVTHMHVNVIAPILITDLALRTLGNNLYVINVSSGAAKRPVYGWGVYGSGKAALNQFTETMALEQQENGTDVHVIGFSPGVMDTEMQGVIRSSDEGAFQDVSKFREMKEKGILRDTDFVASTLYRHMKEGRLENGSIYRIDDLL